MSQDTATVAEQEYLEIMFWLEEAGLPMTGANIARAMQLSPPTVHEMIGRLDRRRLRRAQRRQVARLHRVRARARQPHRPPPPDDRALPHRRARHPLGRGPRGGRADRARDVAGAGGADAGRDRRRHDLPPRPPDRRGRPRAGRRCSPTSRSAPTSTCCASRTRPRSCSTTCKEAGLEPGPRGQGRELRRRRGRRSPPPTARHAGLPQRRRDRLGPRRPGAAAARGDPRAAGALERPLRPLGVAQAARRRRGCARAPARARDALGDPLRRARWRRRGAGCSRRPRS